MPGLEEFGRSCKFRARELGQRAEVKPIGDFENNIEQGESKERRANPN
jgi:hypothetical protein